MFDDLFVELDRVQGPQLELELVIVLEIQLDVDLVGGLPVAQQRDKALQPIDGTVRLAYFKLLVQFNDHFFFDGEGLVVEHFALIVASFLSNLALNFDSQLFQLSGLLFQDLELFFLTELLLFHHSQFH